MTRSLGIGITCYATFGGSGIIATELGLALAERGHRVHFICSDVPWRLDRYVENVVFHEVQTRDYPLLDQAPYVLALAAKMVDVAARERLDVLHVHYAIPHATAGSLAKQALGGAAPKLVTTLHGTDVTIVGSDRTLLPITRLAITQSDAVTTPSRFLRAATISQLGLAATTDIEVIPNFVDTALYTPPADPAGRPPLVVHNSNFRPLKRVDDVIRIFARVRRERPAQLVLIGDGPERSRVETLVAELGLVDDVRFLGKQHAFVDVLQRARVFLLPSETESFGLAALEALGCGVPVVATRVGGLPEVVDEGVTGFLREVGDIEGMAAAVRRLLDDDGLQLEMSGKARAAALRAQRGPAVEKYEACYRRVLEG